MAESGTGDGEALERGRRRRRYLIIAGIGVAGFFPGFYLGYSENDQLLQPGDTWPPALALTLAVVYLVAVSVGALLLRRQTDGVGLHVQTKGAALAASVLVYVYPLWFLLWKGGFVAEPMHGVIYVVFLLSALAGMAYYRFR